MADNMLAKTKGTIALAGGRAFFVPAGFTQETATMKTEVQYEELVRVFAPLWDASQMLESLKGVAGGGYGRKFLAALEEKLESAKTPLMEHIEKIEKANPGQFS